MGLLDYIGQKAREIPANARAAYRGLLAAPNDPEQREQNKQSFQQKLCCAFSMLKNSFFYSFAK